MAEAVGALDTVYRVLVWTGFAGLGGALALLLVVWPDGWRQRRLALVALAGSAVLTLATLGWLLAGWVGAGPPRVEGTAAIVRLALLAAVGGFFTDLLDGPLHGRRRSAAWCALLALTGTLLAGAAGGRPGSAAVAFTGDVLVAAATLVVGACVCLAAVVLPGDARREVPFLRARTAQVARTAVGATAIVAAVHAVATERSPWGVETADVVGVGLLLAMTVVAVLAVGRVLRAADPAAVTAPPSATSDLPEPAADAAPDHEPQAPRVPEPVPAESWFEPVAVPRRPAVQVYEGPRPAVAAEPLVVLPDTAAAAAAAPSTRAGDPVRQLRRQPAGRTQRGRLVAGLGHVALPDAAEAPPTTRSVHLAGTAEPVVVELPDRD